MTCEDLRKLRALPPLWGGLETDGGGDGTDSGDGIESGTDTGTGSGRVEGSATGAQSDPRGGLAGVLDVLGSGLGRLGVRSDFNFGIDPSLQVGPGGVSTEGGGATGQGKFDLTKPATGTVAGAGADGAGAGGPSFTDPLAALAASLGLDTGTGTRTGTGGGAGAGPGGSNILDKLLQQASTFIPFLESTDLPQTTEGQAIMGSADAPIDTAFQTSRQELENTLGPRQGMSGVLADEEAKLAQQQAAAKAGVQRDFASTYTRRGQQALDDLSALLKEQQASQAAGLGIEENLGQTQQQDLIDLFNAVSGGTGIARTAGDLGAGLLSFAGNENASANADLAQSNQGLAALAQSLARGATTPAPAPVPQAPGTSPTDVPGLEALLLGNPSVWQGNPLVA